MYNHWSMINAFRNLHKNWFSTSVCLIPTFKEYSEFLKIFWKKLLWKKLFQNSQNFFFLVGKEVFLKFCLKVSKSFSQNLSFRQDLAKLKGLLDLGKSLALSRKKGLKSHHWRSIYEYIIFIFISLFFKADYFPFSETTRLRK